MVERATLMPVDRELDTLDHVGCRFGPYVLVERLGRGAMASVFRAQADGNEQAVALKLVYAAGDQRRQFESVINEAMASSAVRHPNVVTCLSYGSAGAYLYIIMELAEGGDTNRLVQRDGCLAEDRALALAADCARGLEAIHAAGFIHRDIKPSNIMLDASGNARIGDLGLGFPLAVAEQAEGVVGTPLFMSPEQACGTKLDTRTDIYSLGATLYYWLAGRAPIAGRSAQEALYQAAKAQRVDLRTLVPKVSPSLAALVETALDPRPEHRFADARALGDAIARIRSGVVEIAVRPPDQENQTGALSASVPMPGATPGIPRGPTWHLPAAIVSGGVMMGAVIGIIITLTGPEPLAPSASVALMSVGDVSYDEYRVAWVGDPLLSFSERGEVRYARSGRHAILADGAALVCDDATAVIVPLIAAGSFSVELVFRIGDIAQSGPARIVSSSLNHKVANLTIGQSGSRLEVRCRTSATNTDGTRISLVTPEGTLVAGAHHLVFVRQGDQNGLWLDGVLVASEQVPGSLDAWDPSLPLAIGDEARGGFPWAGQVDHLVFITRPLAMEEVVSRFTSWKSDTRS